MRYLLSVAWHFLSGKLTLRHAIYALRVSNCPVNPRPIGRGYKGS